VDVGGLEPPASSLRTIGPPYLLWFLDIDIY
jgi:hypothetical protein